MDDKIRPFVQMTYIGLWCIYNSLTGVKVLSKREAMLAEVTWSCELMCARALLITDMADASFSPFAVCLTTSSSMSSSRPLATSFASSALTCTHPRHRLAGNQNSF